MKNIFNNEIVRKVRDEVNDLRKKNKDTKTDEEVSSVPSAPPSYYYHSPSTTATTDTYSHTASSTAGYNQTNAYPTLRAPNQQHNLFERVESTATNIIGNLVGQDKVISTTNKINSVITSGHNAREYLQHGRIVQLVSKSSGRLLQVVMSPNGTLVFDGNGATNTFNTYFTIEEYEKGRIRLHNNYNYLAFENKLPCIMTFPPGAKNNQSIDFRVHDILGTNELIAFESCAYKSHFISISSDGYLKTAHIKEKIIDAQFSVVLPNIQPPMYSYQTPPHQQFNMNPYEGFQPNNPSGYATSQPPPMYQQETQMPPTNPTQNSYSNSSGLYPQFN